MLQLGPPSTHSHICLNSDHLYLLTPQSQTHLPKQSRAYCRSLKMINWDECGIFVDVHILQQDSYNVMDVYLTHNALFLWVCRMKGKQKKNHFLVIFYSCIIFYMDRRHAYHIISVIILKIFHVTEIIVNQKSSDTIQIYPIFQ